MARRKAHAVFGDGYGAIRICASRRAIPLMSNEGVKHKPDAKAAPRRGLRMARGSMAKLLKFIYVSAATGEGP